MPEKPSFPARYAALHAYVAPLNPQLWRLFLGLALMAMVYFTGLVSYLAVFALVYGVNIGEVVRGSTPAALVILLGSFVFMALAAVMAAAWPGRRPILGLIGPLRPALRDFVRVLAIVAPVAAVLYALTWALDPSFAANAPWGLLLSWLPLAVLGLFIQVLAEELVFRGYIMGQLAARFAHPFAWMILPSALFGAAHYEPSTYGDAAWIVCAAIMFWAIMVSDITARTGNLGAAIALHFGNNFMPFFLIGEKGKLDALALNTIIVDPTDPKTIIVQVLYILAMWRAARWLLRV